MERPGGLCSPLRVYQWVLRSCQSGLDPESMPWPACIFPSISSLTIHYSPFTIHEFLLAFLFTSVAIPNIISLIYAESDTDDPNA